MDFTIESKHLILRVLDASHGQAVCDFYQKYGSYFQKYESPYSESFYTTDFQKAMLDAEQKLTLRGSFLRYYAFEREHPDHIIGTISYRDIQPHPVRDCEVGYKIIPECQGKGLAKEMLSATLPLLMREYHLHRVHAFVEEDNLPSIKLLLGMGFQKEGLCRKNFLSTEGWKDTALYALLEGDILP